MNRWQYWARLDEPSKYLNDLRLAGVLADECPPLHDLIGVQQSAQWHPEGDAYVHTLLVCDAMAKICDRDRVQPEDRELYMLAALCHDFGKAVSTRFDEVKSKWTSKGHDVTGVPIAQAWLSRGSMNMTRTAIDFVTTIVRLHMSHSRPVEQMTARSVRKLAVRLREGGCNFLDLDRVMEADCNGRGLPEWSRSPAADRMMELVSLLGLE